MTNSKIKAAFLEALANVAPEIDVNTLDPQQDLRDAFDLDSMDILNLTIELHDTLGVDIPEADVPQLTTVAGALDYLEKLLG